ncbi:oligosaccharide flippase family protein [Enterococcus casseliflavus]|uniref:oligosaccharide flippase family protein n=1 Tax=Enterococcus casseliflavus TaxID=37734 RepID=UPI001330E90A|nr:oligosaccharide flippase family protein [Enterococcus casseliflavus]
MRRKLITNFFYQASYQVLLIILPIITIPIVSNALGPEGIGKFNFVNSIAAYFILVAGLGMANYGVREISIVKNNKDLLSKKFWELAFFNLIFSSITFILYILVMGFFGDYLYFMITSITIFSCIFDITWFFAGIEDFKKITIRNFVIKIIGFLLVVILIKNQDDLILYFIISSLSVLFSQLSLWISIKKHVYFVKVSIRDSLSHLKSALDFFLAKVAITIYQNTTKTILGLLTTMSVVGIYSNAYSIVMMSANIINAMNTIMIPRMSNMYSQNDEDGMVRLLQRTIHLQIFFTIPITFGIILTSSKLVPWFFGNEFLMVAPVLKFLSPVVIFQSFQMAVASQYLIPKKDMKEYNFSVISGAVVTIITTIILVPFLSIYGAVIGLNMGYIFVSYLRLKVLLKETTFHFNLKEIFSFLLSAISMWVITDAITQNMNVGIFTTIFQVVLGTVIYFILTFLFKSNPLIVFLKKND